MTRLSQQRPAASCSRAGAGMRAAACLPLLMAPGLLPLAAPRAADFPAEAPPRRVAITLDDLPLVEEAAGREEMDRITDAILAALRRWLDAGAERGNHSHSHKGFQSTPLQEYQDDALIGDLFPRLLMQERGQSVRYYRHPFNQTGPSAEARAAFERFAAERGYTVVPFTVEHADYIYNELWHEARQAGDENGAERIRSAYLEQLDIAFDFAEQLALETFQRPIPQVFLIHANAINAAALESMLARLAQRGYGFIALEEALADAAYASPDTYIAGNGVSWLHRWRQSMDLPSRLRDEPDPPPAILEAWLALQRRCASRRCSG